MVTTVTSTDIFNLINNVHTINNLTEHCITPTLSSFTCMVKERVIFHVNEKLGRCRVRGLSTCHCNRTFVIAQAVICFIFDCIASFFFFKVFVEATTLDHETVNHTVKDNAVIKAVTNILQEVFSSFRCFFSIKLKNNTTFIGV